MDSTTNTGFGPAEFITLVVMLGIIGAYVTAIVFCFLKGKPGMAAIGILLFAPCAYIGALRLAKPDSSYARKHYGPAKMALARERFKEVPANYGTDTGAAYSGRSAS